ncbi:MAG: ethanolamine ammonia-lyase subunit EutC [Steroidobacteraceae bacterium]|jgi:ethanolamine ammonia-lyase small subunit
MSDVLARLRSATPARVGLGRCGHALPTRALLDFQLAHACARDAVHEYFDPNRIIAALGKHQARVVHSRAPDRATYLRRVDLGRQLEPRDASGLQCGEFEVAFVVADGLSALAVHAHAVELLRALFERKPGWASMPLIVACQARVGLGDEIGERLGAKLIVVLIGERPGLSSPDSLGVYLTWKPRRGRQDSERNCISNIRPPVGLSYELAAARLAWLMNAAAQQRLTGTRLKDQSTLELPRAEPAVLVRYESSTPEAGDNDDD